MVKVRYLGVSARELEACRAAVEQLRDLRTRCKPLGESYMALSYVIAAYQRAATIIIRQKYFFGGGEQGPRS